MRFRFLVHLTLFICVSFASTQNVFSQDFNRPRKSDYPNLPKSGKSINDFVPQDWETVGKAQGDLNGDKLEDCALVIKANLSKFLNKNDGLGSNPFDRKVIQAKWRIFKISIHSKANCVLYPPLSRWMVQRSP